MKQPGLLTMTLKRGDSWHQEFGLQEPDGTPVDLAGFTLRMQVRTGKLKVPATLVIDMNAVGAVGTMDSVTKRFPIDLDEDFTADLIPGTYVYDIELTSPVDTVTTYLEGQFIISADVSKPL